MSDIPVERILVVPTELFHRLGYFQGFSPEIDRYLGELFSPQNISFRPRPEMEHDPSFKQLIPYVVFRHCDAAGRPVGLSIHARQRPGRGAVAPQAERGHWRAYLGR